ncbi:MAG: hypothetical protein JWM98_1708 [Thermoleophilia bacterium]|nr:hypothetical protein [Thermoleophilia bacterium]
MTTSSKLTQAKDGSAAATHPSPAAATPRPSGRAAPTEPAPKVDPALQDAMERVEPAPGFAVARLMLAPERESELGLPAGSVGLLDAAMLRIVTLHHSDDSIAREYPLGTVVFASLDGLAPLLSTRAYLLPLDRIQGAFPGTGTGSSEPIGFRD